MLHLLANRLYSSALLLVASALLLASSAFGRVLRNHTTRVSITRARLAGRCGAAPAVLGSKGLQLVRVKHVIVLQWALVCGDHGGGVTRVEQMSAEASRGVGWAPAAARGTLGGEEHQHRQLGVLEDKWRFVLGHVHT